ncbi:putative quinol monooxygenase [Sporichthya polymorpha]|uniref:putative quinol monooxygenase n=1 Tax=Sporichthya polymorpha TaxID=35751 RepID=UPI00035CA327|nr:antibiotic biosynthesis monooxygenase [Sporichthya polymorpha]
MSVFVLVEFRARPDRVDDLLDLLHQILPDTRSFDGCKEVLVEQDLDEPTTVLLCERWISRAHFDAYKAWRSERGDLAGLGDILAGRPSTRFFSGRSCD